ncbi:hypothetical protein GCM10009792_21260 [Microcella alkalica]
MPRFLRSNALVMSICEHNRQTRRSDAVKPAGELVSYEPIPERWVIEHVDRGIVSRASSQSRCETG